MKLHFEDNIAFIILTIALQGSGTEDKHNNNDVILLSAKFNFQGRKTLPNNVEGILHISSNVGLDKNAV